MKSLNKSLAVVVMMAAIGVATLAGSATASAASVGSAVSVGSATATTMIVGSPTTSAASVETATAAVNDSLRVQNKVEGKVIYFDLKDVRLTDSPFKNAMDLNVAWMKELDLDRLLSNFRTNAGLKPKAEPYGSWEAMGIAGHTLGHLLTALSQQYASTGDEECKEMIDYIVDELDSCQINFVNGFIGGMPGGDKVFKEVKVGIIRSFGFDLNGIWVPWYNEHKSMMGLSDAYLLAGNEKAYEILVKLADYLWDVIRDLDDEQMQLMMNCEFGGINEAFAQVYALTGDKKYLDAAYKFDHKRIMDPLSEGVDCLPGIHSNTQIPKIIGSAREYELTGNERDAAIAQNFWDIMVHHHSYVNGGNSSGEYLSAPDKLNDLLTNNTCETCNTYNMLKLTQHLFMWTGDEAYIDYYERALYNHILASQNPTTGMTCYFVPLAQGARKMFAGKYNSFTCCMGSGFENHSKYGGAIYAHSLDNETLYLNLYIPSELTWEERDLKLKMETDYPATGKVTLTITEGKKQAFAINVRYPAWATEGISIKVNGKAESVTEEPGSFVTLKRSWKSGDKIEIDMPMSLYTVAIPDNEDRQAVLYGPTLLAGELTEKEPEIDWSKIDRRSLPRDMAALRLEFSATDVPVFVTDDKDICAHIEPVEGEVLTFRSVGIGHPEDVTLIPFYDAYNQFYTVYFDVFDTASWEAQEAAYEAERQRMEELDKLTVDYIRLGEMQPERDHNLRADDSRIGDFKAKKYRYAYEDGFFAFDMKVSDEPMKLLVTFWSGDCGRAEFDIYVDGELFRTFAPDAMGEEEAFVENVIELPEELTKGKESVEIMFKGNEERHARVPNTYYVRMMK